MTKLLQADNLQTWSLTGSVLDSLVTNYAAFLFLTTTIVFSKYQTHSVKLLNFR